MRQITIQELFRSYKLNSSQESLGFQWETISNRKEVVKFYEAIENHTIENQGINYNLGKIELQGLEKKEICDGEQRLTTAIIFISALFYSLSNIRELHISEFEIFEDIIKRNTNYKFSTIKEDNQLFKDCVIDRVPLKKDIKVSESGTRILNALNYFDNKVKNKSEIELVNLLNSIINANYLLEEVKKFDFVYSNIEYSLLFNLLKEEDISKSLAYMIDYKEYENLKTIQNKFSIEVSNKDISIFILIFVGFENEEYQLLKNKKNVHIVSFSPIVLEMVEFKKIPIKIISTLAFAQTVIGRAQSIEVSDIKILMNLKL